MACGRVRSAVSTAERDAGAQTPSRDAGDGAARHASADAAADRDAARPGSEPDAAESADADATTADQGYLLDTAFGAGLDAVSDRQGNALLKWDVGGETRFARWIAAERRWIRPGPVTGHNSEFVDPWRSGHPFLFGSAVDDPTRGVVRRYDPATDSWGPETPLQSQAGNLGPLTVDGAGNGYDLWLGTQTNSAFWPFAAGNWQNVPATSTGEYIVARRGEGAFSWDETTGIQVRRFDPTLIAWRDAVRLKDALPETIWSSVVVGAGGEALAVTLTQDTSVTVSAYRYDPTSDVWGPREWVLDQPPSPHPGSFYGPMIVRTDARHGDLLSIPAAIEGGFETRVARYDPTTALWSSSRVLDGYDPEFEPVTDDAGNAYAYWAKTLLYFDAASKAWTDTPVDSGHAAFATLSDRAFATGFIKGSTLGAFRHLPGRAAWEPATGLPPDATSEVGSVAYVIVPIDPDRALIAWPDYKGVHAAFIE